MEVQKQEIFGVLEARRGSGALDAGCGLGGVDVWSSRGSLQTCRDGGIEA